MTSNSHSWRRWKSGLVTAILCTGLVFCLGYSRIGYGLVAFSYDVIQAFGSNSRTNDIAIISLEDTTDRITHAHVLDRLSTDQARLVASDVFLLKESDPDTDSRLAKAIARNGRVILAGTFRTVQANRQEERPPLEQFRTNALAWGLGRIDKDTDGVARRHYPGTQTDSLPWAAARILGTLPEALDAVRHSEWIWINYYGSRRPFRRWQLHEALNETPGFFTNKIVFIGSTKPNQDESPTPQARWDSSRVANVEVLALSYLNLENRDWLQRLPALVEVTLIVVISLLAGFGLNRLRPWPALAIALLAGFVTPATAIILSGAFNVFLPWCAVSVIQIPTAWICSLVTHLHFQSIGSPSVQPQSPQSRPEVDEQTPTVITPATGPIIPDHELHRKIGEGAYGEVWLAINTVGIPHAVKLVYRQRFERAEPYEREFNGIKKFMPISTSHEGLLNVLHVGRNDDRGYFFYIMEAADDEISGRKIDIKNYRPRNLAGEIQHRGPLPAAECLSTTIDLAEALISLHAENLVHRDIKPANIIYVKSKPKLADIGLVAQISTSTSPSTLVGTEGYLLVEEAGTPQADIYALGKVLYVMISGLHPTQFPELPGNLENREDFQLLSGLNEIAWKACATGTAQRFHSAGEFLNGLKALE